jgi:myo-inositol-1-phosphate synthase
MEGFMGSPVVLDAQLSVIDSPNSAGVVIDAIRYLKVAREMGICGSLRGPSAFTQKSPPQHLPFSETLKECEKLSKRELSEITIKQIIK